jgi:feruloyl esterase
MIGQTLSHYRTTNLPEKRVGVRLLRRNIKPVVETRPQIGGIMLNRLFLWFLFASIFCSVAPASAEAAAGSCEALTNLQLPDTRVQVAESITPNPEWQLPKNVWTGPVTVALYGKLPTVKVPFCRIALVIEKEINVEVWMPRDWNGMFQGVGNGGLTGGVNYPAMAVALERGFATASTDTGHVTEGHFDTDWIPGHPERVVNFGQRAHHLMAETAKKVVAKYYEKPSKYALYNGCSSGGWQGLTEAQKYPGDYDGIVAGAPANNSVRMSASGILSQQMLRKEPAGAFSAEANQLLVKAAIAKCDALDGLPDGLIDDPRKCKFDPAELQCKGGATTGCLTPAQVKRAEALYGPAKTTPGGLKLYPGMAIGTPPETPLPGADPGKPAIMLMMQPLPDWTIDTFDPDKHIPQMDKQLDADLGATQTDLSAFFKRGGKLILYHGWADQILSPYNTIDYYEDVRKTVGAKMTDVSARLFMAPGMAHCVGGTGPNVFDAVDAMVNWVEHGKSAEQILATHVTAGKVDRSRPLCAYPKVAKYKGSGSIDDAANFTCVAP